MRAYSGAKAGTAVLSTLSAVFDAIHVKKGDNVARHILDVF
jgi:hypothetical protein